MGLSEDQQERMNYLAESREQLLQAVSGLSESQAHFKPAPSRWSIAQVVEHIATIEGAVTANVFGRLSAGDPADLTRDVRQADADLKVRLVDRGTKITAPEIFTPKGQPLQASLERFLKGREHIFEILDGAISAELRKYSIPHPALGMLDGHQWAIAVAGHCARHTQQIEEVKAAAGYPKT